MKLTDLYKSIISKEPYNDMDIFFSNYENFEEIPLISKYSSANQLVESLGKSNTLDFLIGLSVFLINSISAIARTKDIKKQELFVAISFTNFDESHENEPIIPNIFFYPGQNNDFKRSLKKNHVKKTSAEMTKIKGHFSNCHLEGSFIFYESRFFDETCDEEFVRIFAIPKPQKI